MVKPKKKTVVIILLILVVAASISFGAVNAMKSKKSTGISVTTTKLVKQDIESNIFTSGTVVSKNNREITADIWGKVKKIMVDEGDQVKKGDILATLDSDNIRYELKQSEIKLEIEKEKLNQLRKEDRTNLQTVYKNTEIEYNDALKNYEDKKALFESGVVSENDLQEAENSMERAYNDYSLAKKKYDDAENLYKVRMQEKEIRAMELGIGKKKADIEKTKVVSPIDGTITEAKIWGLAVVSENTSMFKIEDTENLEVMTNISEYDVGKIKVGQIVKITNDGIEKKEYKGTVTHISPSAFVEKNGQGTETVVRVKIDINDKNTEFKPNFSANVEINIANKKGVFVLPYETIYNDKDGNEYIFIVKNNKAKKCLVETGIESDMTVEIIGDDLKEDAEVILNPTEMIKDGTEVEVNKGMLGKKGKKR